MKALLKDGLPLNTVQVYLAQEVIDDPETKVGAVIKLGATNWKILAIDDRLFTLQWRPDGGDDGGDQVVSHSLPNRRERRAFNANARRAQRKAA